MTWVKIDDHFPDHPKLLKLGDDYDACVSLHIRGLCYCATNLTDGFIPTRIFHGDERLVSRLVEIGLWETCDGGHRVHDYLDYNPSSAEVATQREQLSAARSAAGKLGAAARWDGKHGKGDGKERGNGDGIRYAPVPVPDPLDPEPDKDPVSSGLTDRKRKERGSYPQADPEPVIAYYAEKLDRDLTTDEKRSVERWVHDYGPEDCSVGIGYAAQDGFAADFGRTYGQIKALERTTA